MFNGDFHWLDVDPKDFVAVSETVLAHHATKGNVEAELASAEDAGCGCAYPDYVDDAVVERSNQIMTRLRATAGRFPELRAPPGRTPRYLTATVGGQRSASSMAILSPWPAGGWPWRPWNRATSWSAARSAGKGRRLHLLSCWSGSVARRSACSPAPTPGCPTPRTSDGARRRLVVNNGSAGLGNFADTTYGVITRLSSDPQPPADSLYGISLETLRCDAVPVRFDLALWTARFLAQWPPASPGHDSYLARITQGTQLRLHQAARGDVKLAATPDLGVSDGSEPAWDCLATVVGGQAPAGTSSPRSCWTRASISSRIRRTTSTGWPAGSWSSQSS